MLHSWNSSIFSNVRDRLLSAAMKFLYAERSGEAFDSQLVIGVRESFGGSIESHSDNYGIWTLFAVRQ
jgi:hypothetical protein